MRNKKIAARIQAALERSQTPQHSATIPNDSPTQKLAKIQCIVDGRVAGERNWKVDEIAKQENIGYMTVYRSLKGKPGWFAYQPVAEMPFSRPTYFADPSWRFTPRVLPDLPKRHNWPRRAA
jgi:hypothetical protein